jgi:hypothetical protein
MGFFILGIALIVLGIIINHLCNDMTFGGFLSMIFGALVLIVCFIALLVAPLNTQTTKLHYKQDSTFVANACQNKNLTEAERLRAIEYAISWNTGIAENKYLRHNFWFRWLCRDIEDLTPMNIDKIMPADNKLTIETKEEKSNE